MDKDKLFIDEPAFPVVGVPGAEEDYSGMTLRDWFAGQALPHIESSAPFEDIADECYLIADSMLKRRRR